MHTHVDHSEILDTHNKSDLKSCLFHGKVDYLYDSRCKSYILSLNNGSLTIPKSVRETLELVRPFVLFEVFFYPGKLLTIEFTTTDSSSTKRRLMFTQTKELIRNVLHARIPNTMIRKNAWIHLSFDLNSLFSLCFPMHSFRSVDSIFISGTLKIRKVLSLMRRASEMLPGISEVPRFKTELQEIDSGVIPKPRPLYYSSSPVKAKKSTYVKPRENLFSNKQASFHQLKALKKEYIRSINLGPKWLFRSPKPAEDDEERELRRKITHNHSRNEGEDENENEPIEESIEADKQPWIDMLRSNSPPKAHNPPDYYSKKLSQLCQIRHFTPPFVNSKDNITYQPADRHYDNLKEDYGL
jgi:hypothetical protein